ncbi:MAG: hypothetical protein AAGA23_10210 [Pseudomonadota bacterium]
MAAIHEVQGYLVMLDKVIHVTRVFDAGEEGAQFNVQCLGDVLLRLKFPDRAAATLDRDLLKKALLEAD